MTAIDTDRRKLETFFLLELKFKNKKEAFSCGMLFSSLEATG